MTHLSLLGALFLQAACDTVPETTATNDSACAAENYTPSKQTIADVAAQEAAIWKILENTPICDPNERNPGCEMVTVTSSGHDLAWENADPDMKVMIIDGGPACQGMRDPAERHYRFRIAGRYELTDDLTYHRCETTVQMPRALSEIYHSTPGAHRFIPVKSRNINLSKKITETFPNKGETNYCHGDPILTSIAEDTPQATFVLVDAPHSHADDLDCTGTRQDLQRFQKKVADGLKSIIRTHGVHYVVYSAGATRDNVRDSIRAQCGEIKDLESRVDIVYETADEWTRDISSVPGVVLIQAAASIRKGRNLEDFRQDCDTSGYPQRLRVGHVDAADANFGREGVSHRDPRWQHTMPKGYDGAGLCIDLYVNSGLFPWGEELLQRPGPFAAEIVGAGGMGSTPFPFMSASYAAPLAASYLMHLTKAEGAKNPDNALQTLLSQPERNVRDPLRHGCFESYRLGKAWHRGSL